MKNHKKPPKPKPAPPSKPSPQPRPAAVAATAAPQAEPTPFDSHRIDIRIGLLEQRVDRRHNSLEQRVDLIADDVKRIYYALERLETHLNLPLRHLDIDRATDAQKSQTQ
jgi:outer membrane biosynthesis protein TonB